MNSWEILEIEPTEELSVIKKAYAKKLKVYHPEDDPEGFQKLREAYDNALKYAKKSKSSISESTKVLSEESISSQQKVFNQPDIKEADHYKEEVYNYNIPHTRIVDDYVEEQIDYYELIDEFFESAESLYNDFYKRIDTKNWQELLNHDIMWQLNYKEQLSRNMIEFLFNHRYLPRDVWRLLNETFNWSEMEEYLAYYYPKGFINYFYRQLGSERIPGYKYFRKVEKFDFEKYLELRERAFANLLNGALEEAKENIFQAYELYDKDPYLKTLEGEYYIKNKKNLTAKIKFNEAVKLTPKDIEIHYFQAETMFDNKRYKEALKICSYIEDYFKTTIEVKMLIGKCNLYRGKLIKAAQMFRLILEYKPLNTMSRKYLAKTAELMRASIYRKPPSILLRLEIKKIYRLLGEEQKIKDLRFTLMDCFRLIKRLFYLFIFLVIALLVLQALLNGEFGAIGVVIVVRIIYSANKRRRYK
ncbi:J domain-containing protein [Clostridium manihotivorum]|uniref:J domain-containing protein n=1 Tax=Clostridium manihotivorum TaxID=2320868 RepID=A0A410DWJ9_9CLOT|nr:hypothetical protein [Clostridium manihotivorum]QAA33420.1 hypothetical protein C1I91_18200 [Clostridium manihotivorum]